MIRNVWHKVRQFLEPKAVVLMYHRVDQLSGDPWQLAVSPAHFEEHLRVIRRHWKPVSLLKLARYVADGSVIDRSVALTFDDGYVDNFEQAKPLLEKYQIPATFFITTRNCEEKTGFWWDELQQIILETPTLPEKVTIDIGGERLHYALDEETTLNPSLQDIQRGWITSQQPPTKRCHLYLELWQRIRPLAADEQLNVMTALRDWAGQLPAKPTELTCMTPDQIQALLTNPLFSIGGHTVTHPALADQPSDVQQSEIRNGKAYLDLLTDKPVQLFAYPYGSYTDETVRILDEAGIRLAVTTRAGAVTKSSQLLQVNRYQVADWDGDVFASRLTQWFRN